MDRMVLIVDDDKNMLQSLKLGLERYKDKFSVITLDNGVSATEALKNNSISLVVADVKMPRMDGLSLLNHMKEHYPDIPIIIITGYGTEEMEQFVREKGAFDFINKPFLVKELGAKIIAALNRQTEGGSLHNVSSGTFLQLIEMEERTCTIRLKDSATNKVGVLFFKNGILMDARLNGLRGEPAAYEIFSWDKVSLWIQNSCPYQERRIQGELQAILLEAMRRKDERQVEPNWEESDFGSGDTEEIVMASPKSGGLSHRDSLLAKMEESIGGDVGLIDIYDDSSWDSLLAQAARIGIFFGCGNFKAAYVSKGEKNDYLLVKDKQTTVMVMDPGCPRDRILKMLSTRP